MVTEDLKKKLIDAGVLFTEEELDAMDNEQAIARLERSPNLPWLLHGCRDLETGKPQFIRMATPADESDPYTWFHDAEVTYVAVRVLLAANETVSSFHAIGFHMSQQIIEKGAKSILALQYAERGEAFKPKNGFGHDLLKAIEAIGASTLLPEARIAVLRQVAEAFKTGHFVGKYLVNTGGGMGIGLDWMRPIDCYMRVVYDFFRPKLAPRRASFIDQVIDGRAFSGLSCSRCGIGPREMKRALSWRNPVFVPNWEEACKKLADDQAG